MRILLIMIMMQLPVAGTGWASSMEPQQEQDSDLEVLEAKTHLLSGKTSEARLIAERMLAKSPKNTEAQTLMAEVIDREIADEAMGPHELVETLTAKEKKLEIERWLERAKTLFVYKQYEQALLAAEKVFTYDSQNPAASRLMDDIQRAALDEGIQGITVLNLSAREEAKKRIQGYHAQIEQWMAEGKFGAAKLAIDKVLILDPDDNEALRCRKQLKETFKHEA